MLMAVYSTSQRCPASSSSSTQRTQSGSQRARLSSMPVCPTIYATPFRSSGDTNTILVLSMEDLSKTPFLILGNKIDHPSAVSEDQLRHELGLYQTSKS